MGNEPQPGVTMQGATNAAGKGLSWRKLLGSAAISAGVVVLLASAFIFKSADPPFIMMALFFLVGGLLALRPGKLGVIGAVLAVLAAAMFTVFTGPHAAETAKTPEGGTDFILPLGMLVLCLTILISAVVAAIKGKGGAFARSRAASTLGAIALILFLVIVATGLYSSSQFESVAAEEGDVSLVTEDFEFEPKTIEAEAGTVSVHISNEDNFLHTFTIEELGVDVAIPGGKDARVTFEAEAGEYSFVCKPHAPDMAGELEVS